MSKPRIPSEFAFQVLALLAAVIVVHAFYVGLIRPSADVQLAAQAALQASGEAFVPERSFYVVIRDFEQEACLILMFWAMFLIFDKIMQITKSSFLFDVDFLKDNDLSQPNIKIVLSELDTMQRDLADAPLIRVLRSSLRRFLVARQATRQPVPTRR